MLKVPEEFLREETREGYTISEMMKRSWAAQLSILDSLKKLFKKYDLHYFADCGTLLGAVRHGGYIPWDDDLDIAMSRKDFMVLIEHADEIEDGLCIRTFYNSEMYMNFHAVVTHKSDVLKWDQERMNKYFGCPFICYVDIFPWDYVHRDAKKFKLQKQLFSLAYKLAYDVREIEVRLFEGRAILLEELSDRLYANDKEVKELINNIKDLDLFLRKHLGNDVYILPKKRLRQQLLIAADRVAQMCPEKDADAVDYCSNLAVRKYDKPRNKKWQEEQIEMPFEFTSIMVPKEYGSVLNTQFGKDYMIPQKCYSEHGYPFFRDEVRVLINGDTGDILPDVPMVEPSLEDIPDGIRPFLVRSDGSLKRIVIYGISATDIINQGHRAIDTIMSFLNDHENSEDTIIFAFAPVGVRDFLKKCDMGLLIDYSSMIQEIETMNNVVWDEEPDSSFLWATISLCDEYIGDECRLAEICRKFEVPVTIQEYQPLCTGLELKFSNEFFLGEVRNGFFVSEMMKRFWAAQMVVLSEIDKVCQRHGINWFADMGTLIGVIRHKGFVPWDDDLDISMLRDDYEKFFRYAPNELPEGYLALTVNNSDEYLQALGRVTNGPSINTSSEHLDKYCGCPYVIGVDVFPIDRIYKDPDKEADRKKRAKAIYNVGQLISEKGLDNKEVRKLLAQIESDNKTVLHRKGNLMHELAVLLDKVSSECHEDEIEAAFMYPWVIADRMNCDMDVFRNVTKMPFENIMIRVPARYDELLTEEYGDYMTIHKGGGMHDYPVYHVQEDILRKKLGHNPYRYTLDNKVLEERIRRAKIRDDSAASSDNNEILFLPCREMWWKTMKPLYDKAIFSGKHNVSVIPVPYYDCDYKGNVGAIHYEKEWADGIFGVTDFDSYNLVKRHPSKIVIQIPYDEWSTVMTVHERLYSDKLLDDTDELIYFPCFDVDPPTSDDDKIISAMKPLIEQPAVVNADKVVVCSTEMKVLYVETLVLIAGDDTREYWENKICIMDEMDW